MRLSSADPSRVCGGRPLDRASGRGSATMATGTSLTAALPSGRSESLESLRVTGSSSVDTVDGIVREKGPGIRRLTRALECVCPVNGCQRDIFDNTTVDLELLNRNVSVVRECGRLLSELRLGTILPWPVA